MVASQQLLITQYGYVYPGLKSSLMDFVIVQFSIWPPCLDTWSSEGRDMVEVPGSQGYTSCVCQGIGAFAIISEVNYL